jgi:hypothetical protein
VGDSWGEESPVNQVGTGIMVIPAIGCALVLWGLIPLEVPVAALFVVVAVCGAVGGVINVMGRGPLPAGALVGVVSALGGFGAVYLWISNRQSVRWFEIAIAFLVGAAPGFLLQYVLARALAARE